MIISISQDKKNKLITLSVSHYDMKLAQKVLILFLNEASRYLIENDLLNTKKQLEYYAGEMQRVQDTQLKMQLSARVSALINQQIILKSSNYYKVKKITEPYLPYYKDKAKPQRALMLVVGMIGSFIIAIILAFTREFFQIRRKKKYNETEQCDA